MFSKIFLYISIIISIFEKSEKMAVKFWRNEVLTWIFMEITEFYKHDKYHASLPNTRLRNKDWWLYLFNSDWQTADGAARLCPGCYSEVLTTYQDPRRSPLGRRDWFHTPLSWYPPCLGCASQSYHTPTSDDSSCCLSHHSSWAEYRTGSDRIYFTTLLYKY